MDNCSGKAGVFGCSAVNENQINEGVDFGRPHRRSGYAQLNPTYGSRCFIFQGDGNPQHDRWIPFPRSRRAKKVTNERFQRPCFLACNSPLTIDTSAQMFSHGVGSTSRVVIRQPRTSATKARIVEGWDGRPKRIRTLAFLSDVHVGILHNYWDASSRSSGGKPVGCQKLPGSLDMQNIHILADIFR
uniref:Uncharacterized protein n=2 Tax=Candidatus Kentrum sp. SD TaxID=2126332 RepID=A0A451BLL2_9GAMM|nr:MAG: hypothetical protein BECKSD772D_GA0070982_10381 [Candidatus Kentron sp. SD]